MKKKTEIVEESILDTNSAKADLLPDEQEKATPEERKKMLITAIIAIAVLAAIVVVFVIGALYASNQDAKAAAREPREATPTFYGELTEEEMEDGKIVSMLTQAYYTVENGMMVDVAFANQTEADERITKVIVTILTKDGEEIAKAETKKVPSDFIVAAGETNDMTIYLKPKYVSIKDDPLETLAFEITIEHETAE